MLNLKAARRLFSQKAEILVAQALQRQGWRILARNFRQHGFELDLVAFKGETLIFLEVKARSKRLQECVDFETLLPARKKQALRRGGEFYAVRYGQMLQSIKTMRFDLAIVTRDHPDCLAIQYFVDVLGNSGFR